MALKSKKSESAPRAPDLAWETKFGYPLTYLVGIDEVGRGCLAGPVVAGALILPEPGLKPEWVSEIKDSKLLGPEDRERLVPLIEGWALSWGIGVASVEEINSINIFHASHLAMVRAAQIALQKLGCTQRPIHGLVDGKFLPKNLPFASTAIIKGDLKCLSIAASSILAKVWRDRRMAELDREFPGYGFAGHKGYATPVHQAALVQLGPCRIHRRGFAPVAKLLRSAKQDVEGLQPSLF